MAISDHDRVGAGATAAARVPVTTLLMVVLLGRCWLIRTAAMRTVAMRMAMATVATRMAMAMEVMRMAMAVTRTLITMRVEGRMSREGPVVEGVAQQASLPPQVPPALQQTRMGGRRASGREERRRRRLRRQAMRTAAPLDNRAHARKVEVTGQVPAGQAQRAVGRQSRLRPRRTPAVDAMVASAAEAGSVEVEEVEEMVVVGAVIHRRSPSLRQLP